jgi:hypothetical protein
VVIPFFGRDFVSLKFARPRPDNPRTTKNEDGEEDEVKYEQPKDELIRPYFPPLVRPLLDDPGLPLVIPGGEKKACAGVQAGLPCVGLAGVWCWHDTSGSAKGKGRRKKRKTMHPAVKAAITKCRRLLVGFDTPDTATNPDVQKAERSLLNALRKAGAVATALHLPENPTGEKVGVDDFIAANGPEAFRALVEAAPAPQPAAPARPIITITTEEFVINDLAVAALSREPNVYSRGGYLVRVLRDRQPNAPVRRAEGAPRIAAIQRATLREDLTRVLEWRKINQQGEDVPAHPPKWCCDAIHARGEWPGIRPLAGVVESPVLPVRAFRRRGRTHRPLGPPGRTNLIDRAATPRFGIRAEKRAPVPPAFDLAVD